MNAKLFSISLLTAGVLLATGSPASAGGYKFTDLGTLPEGSLSGANAINNSGQVAGYSDASIERGVDYDTRPKHAVIWNDTTPTELGGGWLWDSFAYGINDSGQVVGSISYGKNGVYAFIWNSTTPTMLGGDSAYGINNAGQVVGYADGFGALIWDGPDTLALGVWGEVGTFATAINNSGQVVGHSTLPFDNFHATIWNGTTPTDLGTLGGRYSKAMGINDSGQVVGWSNTFGDSAQHAVIWNGTTPTDLGSLGGYYSSATGVNNSGQVVGYSNGHATIWNGTTPTDLNSFLSVSEVNEGWVLNRANDINDNGWVVGNAHNSITGVDRAFLLTPVPEPETYAMFLAGLGLMGFIARRRKNGQA